ncbi:hypothetical protein Bca101_097201 [Brassica carinata]
MEAMETAIPPPLPNKALSFTGVHGTRSLGSLKGEMRFRVLVIITTIEWTRMSSGMIAERNQVLQKNKCGKRCHNVISFDFMPLTENT